MVPRSSLDPDLQQALHRLAPWRDAARYPRWPRIFVGTPEGWIVAVPHPELVDLARCPADVWVGMRDHSHLAAAVIAAREPALTSALVAHLVRPSADAVATQAAWIQAQGDPPRWVDMVLDSFHGAVMNPLWSEVDAATQAAWAARFQTAREEVVRRGGAGAAWLHGVGDLREAIRWSPAETDDQGYLACTAAAGTMDVGQGWVIAAESDPEEAWAVVVHELVGHWTYGPRWCARVLADALRSLEVPSDIADSLGHALAYPEEEIYCLLLEDEVYASRGGRMIPPLTRILSWLERVLCPMLLAQVLQVVDLRVAIEPRLTTRSREVWRSVRASG